ncbi:MAG: AraC family transcriptional regulator [Myxococcales bacterium]|nr:AraC family transcriptional regulator [Myxococcales bacterium]
MGAALQDIEVLADTTVSVNVAQAFVDTASHMGIPGDELLRAAKLEPSWLKGPQGTVRRSEVYRLFEAALDVSGDCTLALHWGAGLRDQALSIMSNLVRHAATLRLALEGLSRFSRLLTEETGRQIIERDDLVTVLLNKPIHASPRAQRFMAELTLAGLYRLIRLYSPTGRILNVSVEYSAPAYRDVYARAFGGAERFDQAFTGIQFDRALMNAASPYKDEDLHCALHALAERRLMHVTDRMPYWLRTHEVLIRQRAPHRVPMSQVARQLDISVRSLRRRLSEEGKSYRDIANDACKVIATQLIGNERRTIQETAYAMGFGDANAFHRAFKRWTGTTPTEFRAHY